MIIKRLSLNIFKKRFSKKSSQNNLACDSAEDDSILSNASESQGSSPVSDAESQSGSVASKESSNVQVDARDDHVDARDDDGDNRKDEKVLDELASKEREVRFSLPPDGKENGLAEAAAEKTSSSSNLEKKETLDTKDINHPTRLNPNDLLHQMSQLKAPQQTATAPEETRDDQSTDSSLWFTTETSLWFKLSQEDLQRQISKLKSAPPPPPPPSFGRSKGSFGISQSDLMDHISKLKATETSSSTHTTAAAESATSSEESLRVSIRALLFKTMEEAKHNMDSDCSKNNNENNLQGGKSDFYYSVNALNHKVPDELKSLSRKSFRKLLPDLSEWKKECVAALSAGEKTGESEADDGDQLEEQSNIDTNKSKESSNSNRHSDNAVETIKSKESIDFHQHADNAVETKESKESSDFHQHSDNAAGFPAMQDLSERKKACARLSLSEEEARDLVRGGL